MVSLYKVLQIDVQKKHNSYNNEVDRLQHKEVSANAKSWVDAWDKWTMDLETILNEDRVF